MKFKNYFMMIIGIIICALSFNIFMVPNNILPGGVSGIAIIINNFYSIDRSLLIFIMSFILLIISFIFLGKKKTVRSILGSLLFPLFVYLTEILLRYVHIQIDNLLLASIFGGISFGFGLGIVYKEGFTTGGSDIIIQILHKYLKIGMGSGYFTSELIIIAVGGFAFQFNIFMYSLITIYLSSTMVDKVIIGISNSKSFYIITDYPEKVSDYILKTLNHGVTVINARGAYSNEKKKILMTVIPTRDYYRLKEGLRKIDVDAFFVVCDSYEVSGGF